VSQHEIDRREAKLQDDPTLLSPPVVLAPLYACATAVVIQNGVDGATIEVEVSGATVAAAVVGAELPYGRTVGLPAALVANDSVRARQRTSTAVSDRSPEVVTRDHVTDYPAGPPRPEIFPLPLYACGIRTGVGNLIAGGNVWITADGAEVGRVNGCGNPHGVNVAPPFSQNQRVRAWYELCADPSPASQEQMVAPTPSPLPAPAIDPQYAGATALDISNITNGAKVTVALNGATVGTWGCWGGSIRIGGFAPFSAGDTISATQELCPGDPPSPPGSGNIGACTDLPAPGVGPLQGGNELVDFTSYAPGATLSVWLNGTLVGRGGGPSVPLTRAVGFGDTVVCAQDLPGCTGLRALQIGVPCVDAPFGADPAGSDLFPVGITDFASGPNIGRIYYPADDDGTDKPFNARLASLGRVPLVVMAHGNHDPSSPSYLGYDFFQMALARQGIVAASLDLNATNGVGYSVANIEQRADLIIGAVSLLQGRDGTAGWPLAGHLDFGRVGLMGHSRGGEAVVLVPEVINLAGVTIAAVLALAPTEGGATTRNPDGYAFQTILPASDGDVWPNDGAIFYDRARPAPFKSQLYVHFTNHNFYNRQWLNDDSLSGYAQPTAPVQPRVAHEAVLLAYGCAFFRAGLLGQSTTGYLSGTVLPPSVLTGNVHLSFEEAGVTTVDNFEDGNGIATNSLGAPTQQQGGLAADEFAFHQGGGAYNGSFYGDSTGMVARPGGSARVFVEVLNGNVDLTGREVRIRVAEVYAGIDNGAPTGFRLGLRDAAGTEAWVDSDDVGTLPRPFPRNPGNMKTMLETRRFRPGCFLQGSKLDLRAISAIMLAYNRSDERALAFDDLQVV
jgi:dienelactone hydrolase